MLELSAALLSIAAIAFSAARRRWLSRTLSGLSAALGVGGCIAAPGVAEGLLVALVLAMGSASLLVLVLPARGSMAFPLGVSSGLLGGLLLLARGIG